MFLYNAFPIMTIKIDSEADDLIQQLPSDEKDRFLTHLDWIQRHPSFAQADSNISAAYSSIEEFPVPEDSPRIIMLGYSDEFGNLHIATGFEADADPEHAQLCRDQAEAIRIKYFET